MSVRASFAVLGATALGMGLLPSASVGAPDEPQSIDEAKQQVRSAYHRAEQATERYHEITDRLKDTRSQIKALRKDVKREQKSYDRVREQVGSTVANQLTSSPMGPTAKLVTSDDPDELLDGLSALQSYSSNQEERLSELQRSAKKLDVRKSQLNSELETVKRSHEKMAEEKKKRDELVTEAKDVLAELTAEQRAKMRRQEQREQQAATAQTSRDSGGRSAPSVDASGNAQKAIDFAMDQIGDPYIYGATGPDSWDCSGLTSGAWGAAGVSLPRSSSQQAGAGTSVSSSQMSPGDLVFYYSPISHVGIYIGNGKLVHAPHPGSSVEVVPVDSMPITTVRRVG